MNQDTIEIEVNASGAPLVIYLENPWSSIDSDTFTYYKLREEPKCDWCDEPLEQVENPDGDWQEKWGCPFCEDEHYFSRGMYGYDEITVSREEWEVMKSLEHQRQLLRKRYGTPFPKSISDYWIKRIT